MRPLITLLLTLLQLTRWLSRVRVRGRVTDEGARRSPHANVAVLALPDSRLVTGGITNEEGRFQRARGSGQLCREGQFPRLHRAAPGATVQQGFTDLGTVVLRPGGIAMDEVEVVGRTPPDGASSWTSACSTWTRT